MCWCVRVSVCPSVQGFRPLSGKAITQLISNLVYAFNWWVFKMFSLLGHIGHFGLYWPKNNWKWVKMVVSDHNLKKHSHNPIQTCGVHLLGQCSEMIHPCWPNFGPLVATKWLKVVVFNHYLKKYSCNPIQTCCVLLLGESSELIRFRAMLAIFWPFSSHKMTENGMAISDWYLKKYSLNQFKLGMYTYWVSVQNWFALGHVGQIFWPSSCHKMSVNGGFQKVPLCGIMIIRSISNMVFTNVA